MTRDTRRQIAFTATEAVVSGGVLALVIYQAVYHLAVVSPLRPTWLPVFGWLWGSLSLPIAFARLPIRLAGDRSPDDSEGPVELGRVSRFLLWFTAVALVVGSGWGWSGSLLPILLLFPALAVTHLAVSLDPEPAGRLRRGWVSLACLIVIISLPFTAWPLRLTTAVSRAELNTLAAEVTAGATIQGPRRAGVLLIQGSRLRGRVPFLLTAPHPGGLGGLTPCATAELGDHFNLWSNDSVGGGWQQVFED